VIHSLYEVAKAIAAVSASAGGTTSSAGVSTESILAARDNLLYKAIWKDVSADTSAADVSFFNVIAQNGFAKRIGVLEEDAKRWVARIGIDFAKLAPYLDSAEASGWQHVERVNFTTKELRTILKSQDQKYTNRMKFDRLMAELNSPACDIARFVAIDVQPSDKSPKKLTEIGISIYDRRTDEVSTHHFIISEHETLTNRNLPKADRFKKSKVASPAQMATTSQVFQFLKLKLGTVAARHSDDDKWVGTAKELDSSDDISSSSRRSYRTALLTSNKTLTTKLLMNAAMDMRNNKITAEYFESIPTIDLQRLYSYVAERDLSLHPKLSDYCYELGLPRDIMSTVPKNAGSNAFLMTVAFQTMLHGKVHLPTVKNAQTDQELFDTPATKNADGDCKVDASSPSPNADVPSPQTDGGELTTVDKNSAGRNDTKPDPVEATSVTSSSSSSSSRSKSSTGSSKASPKAKPTPTASKNVRNDSPVEVAGETASGEDVIVEYFSKTERSSRKIKKNVDA
jgi:hypothetical protein